MSVCANRPNDDFVSCSDARTKRICLCALELKADLLMAEARDAVETRQARVPDSARESA